MNLPALYAYGCGLTVGLVWRYFHFQEDGFWRNFTMFMVLTLVWPVLVALILYDWYKGRPMIWSKDPNEQD